MITSPIINGVAVIQEPENTLEVLATFNSFSYTTLDDAKDPKANELNKFPRKVINVINENFTFPSNFHGMGFNRVPGITPTPTNLAYSTVRSHDGGLRWQQIETSKGVFNWGYFDSWVNTHQGKDIIFTVFGTPRWASSRPDEMNKYNIPGLVAEPSNMQDLIDFINALMVRSAGRIKYFEVWNEPNDVGFFSGTMTKLAEITRIINQTVKVSLPSAKIISSAVTGWSPTPGGVSENIFINYMNASDGIGGFAKNWIDIVGVHLYTPGGSTRNLPGMIARIKTLISTVGLSPTIEIWDTESGILSPDFITLTQERKRKLYFNQLVLSAACGISRVCWYTYDHTTMGFATDSEFKTWREQFVLNTSGKNIQSVVQIHSDVYMTINNTTYTQ